MIYNSFKRFFSGVNGVDALTNWLKSAERCCKVCESIELWTNQQQTCDSVVIQLKGTKAIYIYSIRMRLNHIENVRGSQRGLKPSMCTKI